MKSFTRSVRQSGFTLLELMLAIMIFSLVLAAIYSTWLFILKGSKLGLETAAEVQRSRIAIRALEDAFVTAVVFQGNITNYWFVADTSGDMAEVHMTSRLPASFPGVGRYGDAIVRRVSFTVESGPEGNELVVSQAPLLQDVSQVEPYRLVLAKNVTLFQLEFWDEKEGDWMQEWSNTNRMPAMVKIALGLGQAKAFNSDPRDLVTRLVAVPSKIVLPDLQDGGAVAGMPFGQGPNPLQDPNLPSGTRQRGSQTPRRNPQPFSP
jgi:prepilin-type N-terminal cleavage/methylation domain-containing protein